MYMNECGGGAGWGQILKLHAEEFELELVQ